MSKQRNKRILLASICIAILLTPAFAVAQSGGDYDLSWYSVDGGGATFCTGGAYTLGGTTGQADAASLSGGDYVLRGGFWGSGMTGVVVAHDHIYLPLVLRNF